MIRKRSSTAGNAVFTSRELVPSLLSLPDEDCPDSHYYRPTAFGPKWVPVRPCFFLGEITGARNAENTWLRHRIYVTDIEGRQQINLDSYTDRPPFDYAKIKPSHTICIRFGVKHHFLDGTLSIRVERFREIYVYSNPLTTLLTTVSDEIKINIPIHLGDKPCKAEILAYLLHGKGNTIPYEPPPPPRHCWQCKIIENDEHKMNMCAQCKSANYCRKECQAEYWKNSHKHTCKCLIVYKNMINGTKIVLDNMGKCLDAFVSTTDEDESDEKETNF
ncbi:unnamed protein product [Rotaria magnacalcarata]|uniref:MYND-type domain-containing protein n=1 Tax=Rotaria magnacalcarata TaxID=392030 RepID=A0A819X4F6_9BILA|nr:unnamed protein product [Rotaria magnacalcarata]CAF2119935.1 unnamed protein product [Rotaria magnacalcarata]CAF3777272.1 unnamed protein product [Rotaria magnacalcarata]CAF4132124.1 unnamed protein product [Rotaria magnacalcarata]